MPPNSVLITGVNGPLGARLAAELVADPSIERVIGVDDTEPDDAVRGLMGRAEFRRIDIRNPAIVTVLNSGKVDTVVHVALTSQPVVGVSRTVHKEKNVIGTMQLLAACQQAPTVGNLVVKSGSGVYGPHQRAASVCTEEMVVPAAQLSGYARDAADVEGYVRGFARRHPDTSVSVFRFANLIGPCLDTVMSRYFALPMLPTVFGYDARLQLLHADDAVAVLRRAVRLPSSGVFNVAGAGVLTLSQAVARSGRLPLPMPRRVIRPLSRLVRGSKPADFGAEHLRYLNFGRVLDTGKLRHEFGYSPQFSTQRAFDDYLSGRDSPPRMATTIS